MKKGPSVLRAMIGRAVPNWARAMLADRGEFGYTGSFESWQEAIIHARDFETDVMLERTREATEAVRRGDADYEQDSVVMRPPAQVHHMLDLLRAISDARQGPVRVIDFGGGLGSKYFWARRSLPQGVDLRWAVVELERHVRYGRANFESEALTFHADLGEAARIEPPNLIACCGVLQYLEDPFSFIRSFVNVRPDYLLFDRTPFATRGRPEIVLQRVDERIYPATIVSWLLSERDLVSAVGPGYTLVHDYSYPQVYSRRAIFRGHVFRQEEDSARASL